MHSIEAEDSGSFDTYILMKSGSIIEVKMPLKAYYQQVTLSPLISLTDNCSDRLRASQHLLVLCMKSGAVTVFTRHNLKQILSVPGNPQAATIFQSGESVGIIDRRGAKID